MKKRFNDYLVIGFALFAMFFGAGNLIFPPTLGRLVGDNFSISTIGFLITGVGLPLLGILACVKSGGNFQAMADKVGSKFAIITTMALILAIGPMVAIPRTAATTFELTFQSLIPSIKPFIAILIYFIINLAFVLKPNSIIDNIGKFLTPILLTLLCLIIVKSFIYPIGPIVNTNHSNVFSKSLLEGYQTMDAMASVIFASIIISSIRKKGYKTSKQIFTTTLYSAIIAVIGLSFIYGGLLFLGAQTTTLYAPNITRTALVTSMAKSVFGSFGHIALSISVGLACLTTSIGLTSTAAEFFSKISKGKLSYKFNAITISIISMIISLKGVDIIVSLASPVLEILYPVVIILIVLNLIGNMLKNNKVIQITVYVTLLTSILSTLASFKIPFVKYVAQLLPLYGIGFAWVIPALIAFLISYFIFNNSSNNEPSLEKTTISYD